ncbi:MAG: phosphatase PAP2 family protein [Ginsengibacter sp.]
MENVTIPGENFHQPLPSQNIKHPLLVNWLAHFFSFVFHPLFIPTLATWYLTFLQSGYFTGTPTDEKRMVILQVAFNTILYPALTVVLLKAVGFIKSILLKTQRERIIPYIATNIFYFWMYLVFKSQDEIPSVLTSFIFGIFLASSLALIANIYFKISMHALGIGALCGLMIVIIFTGFSYVIFLPAMIVFLIAGLVGTSRLVVSNHTPFDIYSGILLGILCQFIASMFIGQ